MSYIVKFEANLGGIIEECEVDVEAKIEDVKYRGKYVEYEYIIDKYFHMVKEQYSMSHLLSLVEKYMKELPTTHLLYRHEFPLEFIIKHKEYIREMCHSYIFKTQKIDEELFDYFINYYLDKDKRAFIIDFPTNNLNNKLKNKLNMAIKEVQYRVEKERQREHDLKFRRFWGHERGYHGSFRGGGYKN